MDKDFNEDQIPDARLAILIDADNAQATLVQQILKEVTKYGKLTIRRIYGDWTTPHLEGWKKHLPKNALQPVQQFRNTTGKNATDSAMIIDAMDVLYGGNVDGFVLVSSDSDYTRLAVRLRESGRFVIGVGKKQTPEPFVRACDIFIYTENLAKVAVAKVSTPKAPEKKKEKPQAQPAVSKKSEAAAAPAAPAAAQQPAKEKMGLEEAFAVLLQAFELSKEDDGWSNLSNFGKALRRLEPAFDSRTYGFSQLSKLIDACPFFHVEREKDKGPSKVYIRKQEGQDENNVALPSALVGDLVQENGDSLLEPGERENEQSDSFEISEAEENENGEGSCEENPSEPEREEGKNGGDPSVESTQAEAPDAASQEGKPNTEELWEKIRRILKK